MKKSEVKGMTNEALIAHLLRMVCSSRILKSNQTCARWICEELKNRGVVDSSDSLFKEWDSLYSW